MCEYSSDDTARDVLSRLKERYRLVILTSRRIQMRDDTIQWLTQHYEGIFKESDVYFAGIWDRITQDSHIQTKAEMAQLIGADYLIDDQLKHVFGVADAGIKGVLFGDYTWNQYDGALPQLVTRVNGWSGVEEYFEHERLQVVGV